MDGLQMEAGNGAAAVQAVTVQDMPTEKCCYRQCRVSGAAYLKCAAEGCNKKVHMMCYQGILLKKYPDMVPLLAGQAVCTKKCHSKVIKENSGVGEDPDGGGRKGNWDCDGLGGPDDPHTSVKILLDWWMTEGNYSKYCGKNNNGIKKKQFCAQLAEKMSRETSSKRDGKNVQSKIQHIERTFKDAHTFATSETGAGIKENDEGTFTAAVKKKCPFYYDLLDIISDRASSKPKVTSYELNDEDDDDDDDDDGSLSELSEEGMEGDKSIGTKRTVTTTDSLATKKKKRGSKKNSPLLDDDALKALSADSKTSEAKMKELVRHHQFIEGLERRKIELDEQRFEKETNSWRGKSDELDYKMKLLVQYNELKENYGWTDEQILKFYPDMKVIVEAQGSIN
jgi:hypothetical protein